MKKLVFNHMYSIVLISLLIMSYYLVGNMFFSVLLLLYLCAGYKIYGSSKKITVNNLKKSVLSANKSFQTVYEVMDGSKKIGEITRNEFDFIRNLTLSSPGFYLFQCSNIFYMLIRSFKAFFVVVPNIIFWILFYLAYSEPDIYKDMMFYIMHEPTITVNFVLNYLPLVLELHICSYLIAGLFLDKLPGFKNYYDLLIYEKISSKFDLTQGQSIELAEVVK